MCISYPVFAINTSFPSSNFSIFKLDTSYLCMYVHIPHSPVWVLHPPIPKYIHTHKRSTKINDQCLILTERDWKGGGGGGGGGGGEQWDFPPYDEFPPLKLSPHPLDNQSFTSL